MNLKREMLKILLSGKNQKIKNRLGSLNGEMEDQDGILNVQQWLMKYLKNFQ
jgi:hypothetical protein